MSQPQPTPHRKSDEAPLSTLSTLVLILAPFPMLVLAVRQTGDSFPWLAALVIYFAYLAVIFIFPPVSNRVKAWFENKTILTFVVVVLVILSLISVYMLIFTPPPPPPLPDPTATPVGTDEAVPSNTPIPVTMSPTASPITPSIAPTIPPVPTNIVASSNTPSPTAVSADVPTVAIAQPPSLTLSPAPTGDGIVTLIIYATESALSLRVVSSQPISFSGLVLQGRDDSGDYLSDEFEPLGDFSLATLAQSGYCYLYTVNPVSYLTDPECTTDRAIAPPATPFWHPTNLARPVSLLVMRRESNGHLALIVQCPAVLRNQCEVSF